jgi:hypothetical protein
VAVQHGRVSEARFKAFESKLKAPTRYSSEVGFLFATRLFSGANPSAERAKRKVGRRMSTGGEVANALVCKTSIHGFKSHSVLHKFNHLRDFT